MVNGLGLSRLVSPLQGNEWNCCCKIRPRALATGLAGLTKKLFEENATVLDESEEGELGLQFPLRSL
jgi:hypothetical protein